MAGLVTAEAVVWQLVSTMDTKISPPSSIARVSRSSDVLDSFRCIVCLAFCAPRVEHLALGEELHDGLEQTAQLGDEFKEH